MQTHINIEHKKGESKVNANVLLAFDYEKEERKQKFKKP